MATLGVFTPWKLAGATVPPLESWGLAFTSTPLHPSALTSAVLGSSHGKGVSLLLVSSCFILAELGTAKQIPIGEPGVFSLRLDTLQHHRPFRESNVVPVTFPSHIQANDGVKTLQVIEVLLKVDWCLIGVSGSSLLCCEDLAGI